MNQSSVSGIKVIEVNLTDDMSAEQMVAKIGDAIRAGLGISNEASPEPVFTPESAAGEVREVLDVLNEDIETAIDDLSRSAYRAPTDSPTDHACYALMRQLEATKHLIRALRPVL